MNRPAAPLPDIDPERCTGCGWCLAVCKPHVLAFVQNGWRKYTVLQDADGCTGCAQCEVRCPVQAIKMQTTSSPAKG